MMESLEIPSFWSVGEEKGICTRDFLPGDGFEDLFDDLTTDDLLFKPADGAPVDASSALGDFDDWLGFKMDFSLLDCVQDHNNALNDPFLVMQKEHGTDLAIYQMEKKPKTFLSSTYTPPSSPEGQVPDVNRPINAVRISNTDNRNLFASSDSCTPMPGSPDYASSSSCDSTFATDIGNPAEVVDVVLECLPAHSIDGNGAASKQVTDVSRRAVVGHHPINTVRISNTDNRNLFASSDSCTPAPRSPDYTSSSSCDSTFSTNIGNPAEVLDVILECPPAHSIDGNSAASKQVADVSRRAVVGGTVNKRSHPYSRPNRRVKSILKLKVKSASSDSSSSRAPPVTRKERKRVQNKNAATRYRQKKRLENQTLEEQEDVLKEENQILQDKAQKLGTEISYLKGLMREMFRAKGLLK